MTKLIRVAVHPLFLVGGIALWWQSGRGDDAVLTALAVVLASMLVLERLVPAHPDWRQSPREKLGLYVGAVLLLALSGAISVTYSALLFPALAGSREVLEAGVGFPRWPILAQVLFLYFASDLTYYWVHRAIHRWGWLWKASGHGVHHAFKNLHAINFAVSHPFEYFLIALPMIVIAALLGASGEAVSGATVLLVVNTSLAHSNLLLDTPALRFFFTTSAHHRLHHSVDFDQSNTNFACNAIVWDRLFGTFDRGEVQQTGIGPRQPRLGEMLLMPFREPGDVETVASRST